MSKAKKFYDLVRVEPENYAYNVGNHRFGLEFHLKQTKKTQRKSVVAVIQMNGSITDWTDSKKTEWKVNPTIGKVLCWCSKQGFDVVHCLNLWSYVDKNPLNLIGKSNSVLNKHADKIILAYGNCYGILPSEFMERKKKINSIIKTKKVYHVGPLNKGSNTSKHGRYWNGNPELNEITVS